MVYDQEDIKALDRVARLKLINSITGIKPANLIGTIGDNGVSNLAIFSSVVHLGSNPALLGFITRPQTKEVGHTLTNILENGFYTINHITAQHLKNAHYTSAKFEAMVSEFDRCGFTEEFSAGFRAPFVKESHFKIGLLYRQSLDIALNGTTLVIGEVVRLVVPDHVLVNGDIDLEA